MSDFKRGLEDKSQWHVHQYLIEYCEERTIGPIQVLNERKGRGILFPRRDYTMTSVVVFLFPSEGLHHERVKVVLFYVMRQSKVWTRKTNWTYCHFVRCFIPKWEFTPWTERIIAIFNIKESCFEFEDTKWIIVQNMELGAFSSSRYSS